MITKQRALKVLEDLRIQVAKEFGVDISDVCLSYQITKLMEVEGEAHEGSIPAREIVSFYPENAVTSHCAFSRRVEG